jgi:tagaturonate epimerase
MKLSLSDTPSSVPLLKLEPYSFGMGDRFAHQAKAQLRAVILANEQGANVTPVWNKSYREHCTVGSEPGSVARAVHQAVGELSWKRPFHIDADHITQETVDHFLASSDYYTLDVAEAIGQPAPGPVVDDFLARHPELTQRIELPGDIPPVAMSYSKASQVATKYLSAVKDAGVIYKRIETARGSAHFITEVSVDETDSPQEPHELLLILAALADEGVPLQTIAPKFTGRFNKGVDYVGDVARFGTEFRADIAVMAYAVKKYALPANLKLSVHSGSDKFSLYPVIHRIIRETGAGLHLKTAGTTWLEELIGLAETGGDALKLAKEIYAQAYERRDELCAPYRSVIDIDSSKLPKPSLVHGWASEQYADALRHDANCPKFNPSLRQLLHVAYKIAAQMGPRYLNMLDACERQISANVTSNLYQRHLAPLFLGKAPASASASL